MGSTMGIEDAPRPWTPDERLSTRYTAVRGDAGGLVFEPFPYDYEARPGARNAGADWLRDRLAEAGRAAPDIVIALDRHNEARLLGVVGARCTHFVIAESALHGWEPNTDWSAAFLPRLLEAFGACPDPYLNLRPHNGPPQFAYGRRARGAFALEYERVPVPRKMP
jgi:hypothetical protein